MFLFVWVDLPWKTTTRPIISVLYMCNSDEYVFTFIYTVLMSEYLGEVLT